MNHSERTEPLGWGASRPDPGHLSALLLRVYDAANSEDVDEFQDRAMAIVNEVIAFRGIWWGRGVGTASGHQVHDSHMRNLPVDLPQLFNAISSNNPMARASASHPNRAFLFAADILYSEPSIAAVSEYMGAHESLCITQAYHVPESALRFLVITRGTNDPPFQDVDRQWLECLNPHLNAALDLCSKIQIARCRRMQDNGLLLAISDTKGFLHLSEPGFSELLLAEWPHWKGTRLPDALVASLASGSDTFDGRHVMIGFRWLGERVLLSLRGRHVFDSLSPQERAISLAFASGQSYKVVARNAGIAPATVRHHLRSAYLKLGVSDKAALAQLAGSTPD